MSIIDFSIIIFYMLGMVILGYKLGNNNESQEDYFLAGRSMPWLPIAFSIAATMISANTFIGAPGWAYSSGIGPFMINITVPLAIAISLYTFLPIFYNLEVTSIYEYLEKRLGIYTRTIVVISYLLSSLLTVSSMIYIPALIVTKFTHINLILAIFIIVLIAIVYTLLGGIKAVIWTDVIQIIILWGGLIIAYFYALHSNNLSFYDTINVAKIHGKLDILDFSWNIKSTNNFYMSLIGGTVMWVRYFGLDQGQVQRVLTSKSYKGLKKSLIISALFMNLLYFLFLFLGVLIFSLYHGKKFISSNEVIINFIKDYIPMGLGGFILAAIFAAAMSSVDSILNSVTTVYTKDIHELFFAKGKTIETSLKSSMIISLCFGIIIIIFTILGFSGTFKSVLDIVGGYISYFSGPMLAVFILAMFVKKSKDKPVAVAIFIGTISTYFISRKLDNTWIINPFIGFVITFIIGYIFSGIFKLSNPNKTKYTIWELKKSILKSDNNKEIVIPLRFDKSILFLIIFFLVQYILLLFLTI